MQVTHVTEPDSHVIIGGGKTHAFGVRASAAAFKIMSDSLYRDKERAAVREIVCNGIDAHAMNGNEKVPVKVTITDDELIVEDQGPGIHDDRIGEIYCTLFASTKEGQDNQTGGFGLGSKAPFAISDHFTVNSRHAGISTLYAMHIGDPTTNGTPGAKVMMKSRTDGTGLTVSVPLASGMRRKIESALKQIVREGGMLVELNGQMLDAPDYSKLKKVGFGLMPLERRGVTSLQVLYANVLYPLDAHDELHAYIQALKGLTFNSRSFIIYCPPSSISVTPSREALSYNEQTIGTLKKVLAGVVGRIQTRVHYYRKLHLKTALAGVERHNLPGERVAIPQMTFNQSLLTGVDEIAEGFAIHCIDNRTISNRDKAKAFLGMMKDRRRGLRQIASIKKGHAFSFEKDRKDYIRRSLARVATKADVLKLLHIRAGQGGKLVPVNQYDRERSYSWRGDYVRPRLYLAATKTEAKNGDTRPGFYVIGKISEKQRERLKEYGPKLGIKVIDLKPEAPVVPEKKVAEQFGPVCPARLPRLAWAMNGVPARTTTTKDGIALAAWTERGRFQDAFKVPQAFFSLKATTCDYKPGFYTVHSVPNEELVKRLIKQNIGEVQMVWKKSDMDFLLGQNIARLEQMVLDKLKARLAMNKPYEAFYAKLAMCAANSEKLGGVASHMIAYSRRFAHAAVREPYAPCPDRDEAWTWWVIAKTVFHERFAASNHLDKAESAIITKLCAEYFDISVELESTNFSEQGRLFERTEHLKLFEVYKNYGFLTLNEQQKEDFLDFAEQLGQRYTARKENGK